MIHCSRSLASVVLFHSRRFLRQLRILKRKYLYQRYSVPNMLYKKDVSRIHFLPLFTWNTSVKGNKTLLFFVCDFGLINIFVIQPTSFRILDGFTSLHDITKLLTIFYRLDERIQLFWNFNMVFFISEYIIRFYIITIIWKTNLYLFAIASFPSQNIYGNHFL